MVYGEVGEDGGVVLEGGVEEDAPRIVWCTTEITDYREDQYHEFSTVRRNGNCRIRTCGIPSSN